jgi:hypothetical protein
MRRSWRKQISAADSAAVSAKRREPKYPLGRPVLQLTRDGANLRRKRERADLIIDAQRKLCVALRLPTSDDRTEEE